MAPMTYVNISAMGALTRTIKILCHCQMFVSCRRLIGSRGVAGGPAVWPAVCGGRPCVDGPVERTDVWSSGCISDYGLWPFVSK